jgi:hypothetical protein
MPRQPPIENRIKTLTACLNPALTLLNEINDVFGTPFVQPILKTVLELLAEVQVNRFCRISIE